MELILEIQDEIKKKDLLKHPFYQDWMRGDLSQEQLQNYALQYIPFTEAFPRFVSAIHSKCISILGRKMLLENLIEEEGYHSSKPHPHLWMNFLVGIGGDINPETSYGFMAGELTKIFFRLCDASFEEGLCALYVYESQIPKISELKVTGLKTHYNINSEKTLEFFNLHQEADVYHSKSCEKLINNIEPQYQNKSKKSACIAAESLWEFLTEVYEN